MTLGSVVTLTPNPAVDLCTSIDEVIALHKLRCADARRDPDGDGINVARVNRRLGGDPVAIFPADGPIGALLQKLVAAESVCAVAVPIAGDTREDITIDERKTGAQHRFVLPGPKLSPNEVTGIFDALQSNSAENGFLVASGSLPRAIAPKLKPVSTVGAGDSFLGALVWALANGEDVTAALRFAVASGTAAMLSPGTDLSHPADIERLASKVEIRELHAHPVLA